MHARQARHAGQARPLFDLAFAVCHSATVIRRDRHQQSKRPWIFDLLVVVIHCTLRAPDAVGPIKRQNLVAANRIGPKASPDGRSHSSAPFPFGRPLPPFDHQTAPRFDHSSIEMHYIFLPNNFFYANALAAKPDQPLVLWLSAAEAGLKPRNRICNFSRKQSLLRSIQSTRLCGVNEKYAWERQPSRVDKFQRSPVGHVEWT
uniref:Uncharacterized protein n=1 Tax=Trichuris muris TaxID=70415 RepID=A0A5S6QFR6_TRIMR